MPRKAETNVSLTLKVSPDFKSSLEAFCRRRGPIMSRLVEDALERELEDQADLAAAAGAARGPDIDVDAYLEEKGFRLVPPGADRRGAKGPRQDRVRILYLIDDQQELVTVLDVPHRKDAYGR